MNFEEEEGEIIEDVYLPSNKVNTMMDGDGSEHYSSDDDHLSKLPPKPEDRFSKYKVWQVDICEDLCTSFNSTFRPPIPGFYDRNVENYVLPSFYRNFSTESADWDGDIKKFKADDPRYLRPLSVKKLNCDKDLAKELCKKLKEKSKLLIYRTVSVLGKKKAIKLYKKTKRIEKDGGLLVSNRTRKRTSGGVFLYLVRIDKEVTPEQMKEIFDGVKTFKRKKVKKCKKKTKDNEKVKRSQGIPRKRRSDDEFLQAAKTPPPSPAATNSPADTSFDMLLDQSSGFIDDGTEQMEVR